MPKFNVYATITGYAYLGEVEAENAEEAQRIAEDEHLEASISLCHQCSRKMDDPTITEIVVEPAPHD